MLTYEYKLTMSSVLQQNRYRSITYMLRLFCLTMKGSFYLDKLIAILEHCIITKIHLLSGEIYCKCFSSDTIIVPNEPQSHDFFSSHFLGWTSLSFCNIKIFTLLLYPNNLPVVIRFQERHSYRKEREKKWMLEHSGYILRREKGRCEGR